MRLIAAIVLAAALILSPVSALLDAAHAAAGNGEGPLYALGSIELIYATSHPAHPPLAELYAAEFALGRSADGLVGPRLGGDNVWFKLPEVAKGPAIAVFASGVRELNEQIVTELNSRGLLGVFVAPHPADIEPRTGRDLRALGETKLRLLIHTGRVQALRTFAPSRDGGEARIDAEDHERIRALSPVQAGPNGAESGDLIERQRLDEYVAYLNRHPGRQVELNVSPTAEPGGVYLDYLVAESRPWLIFGQLSNTGTDATNEWRQRLGFTHHQLTGRDDVLRLDFVTSSLDQVNALFGSYEFPLPFARRTRLGLSANWSEYGASQFGFPDDAFSGNQWSLESDMIVNLFQFEDLFVDGVLGARFMDVEVEQNLPGLSESDRQTYFVPSAGARLERLRDTSTLAAGLSLERGSGGNLPEPNLFGRANLDGDWSAVSLDLLSSFYLEPVLWPRAFRNARTPKSSTLAHEIWLSVRGQHALGNRLIPQAQRTLGGLYTVRGYEQSLVSGDDVYFGQLEYRFHLPSFLLPGPPGALPLLGPFRFRPERMYARPDWDLIFRTFLDAGHVSLNNPVPGEGDQTLLGAGLGLELVVRRNLALRFDYGVALRDVKEAGSQSSFRAESGDGEGYVSATLRY